VSVERKDFTAQLSGTIRLPALSRTRKKLREAEFFLTQLTAEDSRFISARPEAADFYLSAFFASARAVAFIVRTEKPEDYQPWSENWFARLTEEERDLMNFFVERRSKSEKEGSTDKEGTFTTVSLIEFMQDMHRKGVTAFVTHGPPDMAQSPFPEPPNSLAYRPPNSVVFECQTYLRLLERLITEFERDHSGV